MRREIFRMSQDAALRFLSRAEVVRVATTAPDGAPIARTVHAVVVDGLVAFHGAPAGEKLEALGRRAVLWAERAVAVLPSYFFDPERACPATTFYESVQVHGVLREVTDAETKARVLQTLMEKHQPEGGHVPIRADHPLYRKAVAGILVVGVALDEVDGKQKVGQNLQPAVRTKVLEGLWRRGQPGDVPAIERILAVNPDTPLPDFLSRGPAGVRLCCALGLEERGEEDLAQAVALLRPAYWNQGVTEEALARAQRGADAWVGARDEAGRLVATARAVSDGGKHAWLYDVMVAPAWRGRGVGRAVVGLLLGHPAVRGAEVVHLKTKDAQKLYRGLGFISAAELPPRGYVSEEMVLLGLRGSGPSGA
jgi:nitroimidazol reductase NimA-like FMN-containing flavoprotein (pyridoxamine 5'-phosphate oxidase superfamily)/GNAT superfamily N-acetyltransferase